MITRLTTSLGLGLVVLLAAACGGGGESGEPLSLEEYFAELEALGQLADEQSGSIETQQGVDPDDINTYKTALPASVGAFETFVDGLDALDPPSEVADEHDEAVEAGRAFLEEFDRVVDETANISSLDELGPLFMGAAYMTASERATASCAALQTIANENDIDVNLHCEDSG